MIYTEEKSLLMALLLQKRINLYDFYVENVFSTGQIVCSVLKYQRKGYLIWFGKYIYRTPIGTAKIRKLLQKEIQRSNRYWAHVPKECLKESVPINVPIGFIKISRK